jgi:predicted SAM-dependent methyltransferase
MATKSRVLLLGCGSRHERLVRVNDRRDWTGQRVEMVDYDIRHCPDKVWDLNILPWPYRDNYFDEVHAYEVLEHLGHQGHVGEFFGTFWEIYRILKPGGKLAATCPSWDSMWAWGDPSHTRVISEGSLVFLDQEQYRAQAGITPMSDFRSMWIGDLKLVWSSKSGPVTFAFVLEAIKPPRLG